MKPLSFYKNYPYLFYNKSATSAIKSNFYKYGLEFLEPCLEAIKKAIMLEPNNLEYKKMLKELEQEKAMNDKQDM